VNQYQLEDFDFTLPPELIATKPAEPRDQSRLLRVEPGTGELVDYRFTDLVDLLEPNSLLVLNDAKVIPARLMGQRKSGAAIEALLLKELAPGRWSAKVKKAAKLKIGETLEFSGQSLLADFAGRLPQGESVLEFHHPETLFEDLEKYAHPPLPPYILKAREGEPQPFAQDQNSYQTLFAKNYGAVAAPTAGLHMTESLLGQLTGKGIELAFVTLNVGLGTFEPIRVTDLDEHQMHQESFRVSEEAANQINRAKEQGRKVVALGTTSLRTLESAVEDGQVVPGFQETQLFVRPPYDFQVVDQLITNFHLPKSTLLMLVSAFAGYDVMQKAYQEAITREYRFFSYGDAMLLG